MKERKDPLFRYEILDDLPHQDTSTLDALKENLLKHRHNFHSLPDLAKGIMKTMSFVFQDCIFGINVRPKNTIYDNRTYPDSILAFQMDGQNLDEQNYLFPDEKLFFITIDMAVFNHIQKPQETEFNFQSEIADANHITLNFYFYANQNDTYTITGYLNSTDFNPLGHFLAFRVDIVKLNTAQQHSLQILKYDTLYFKDTPQRFELNTYTIHDSLENLIKDLSTRLSNISTKIYSNKSKIQKERKKVKEEIGNYEE